MLVHRAAEACRNVVRGEINDRDRDRDRHDKGWRGHDRGPSQLVVDRVFLEMVVQQQAAAQRGVAETGDHKQEVGVGARREGHRGAVRP